MRRVIPVAAISVAVMLGMCRRASAQTGVERPAVERGVAFLKGRIEGIDSGQAGIVALALIKSGLPVNDLGIRGCLEKIAPSFEGGGYKPLTTHASGLYEAAVVVLALVNIAHEEYKPQINAASQYIISKQMANGAWDYPERTQGDESISQYCLLALWEAENAGITVPPHVWDRAAAYYLKVQSSQGSWTYHRDAPNQGETLSMTAAGVGSLLLCQEQLVRHRKGQEPVNILMTPVTVDGQPAESRYKVETSAKSIADGIKSGMGFMISNFQVNTNTIMGQSPYYALYGIERLAALSGDKDGNKAYGTINWYQVGLDFVLSKQTASGAWEAQHEQVPNTCWAILFSVKATKISVSKIEIRKLGAGQMKAGRELPSNLSEAEVVDGKIVAKPMGGAIEGMLAVLEDPRSENADSALNGLVTKYQTEGPKVIRPFKDRFRKMLRDRDPKYKLIAAWFLGRTGDLDVAPDLIKILTDEDDEVVHEGKTGLMLISRKLEGYGPQFGAGPDQRLAAAQRWREWFESVKPPDLDAPIDILPASDSAKTTSQ